MKVDASTLVIQEVDAKHPDLHRLIEQLDRYLHGLYPPEEIFLVDLESPDNHEVDFVAAYFHGEVVGCGAIKRLDEHSVELKRFFVLDRYRNQGVAGRIYQYLETKAKERGYETMKLETGDLQEEAIHFYKKKGFCEIERFGEYADCPSSLCFEKKLS